MHGQNHIKVKQWSALFKYKWSKAHIFFNDLHYGKQTGSI